MEKMLELTLKPCPFCNSSAIQFSARQFRFVREKRWVFCENCGAEGPLADNQVAATECWNKRFSVLEETPGAEAPAAQDSIKCRFCGHADHGTERCTDRAPNAQFRCACYGVNIADLCVAEKVDLILADLARVPWIALFLTLTIAFWLLWFAWVRLNPNP